MTDRKFTLLLVLAAVVGLAALPWFICGLGFYCNWVFDVYMH